MVNSLRVVEGGVVSPPDLTTGGADLDLHELTASLLEAQRLRVYKAIQEERCNGKGLDQATSVEIKRLMSMITATNQLGRPAARQGRAGQSSRGPVSIMLASLIEKPRKAKC